MVEDWERGYPFWTTAHARVGGVFDMMNFDLHSCYIFVGDFAPTGKILVHCEVEVHTVHQRFKKKWQSQYFACLYQLEGI